MVSDAADPAPAIELPTDLTDRAEHAPRRRERLPWLAALVAALLHGLVLLAFILDWSHPPALPEEPEVIPVKVVFAPPEPPPPAAAPAQPPPAPPAPKALGYRESGSSEHTTAPPPADTTAPEVASPPAAAESTADTEPPPPPEKPAPPEAAKPKPAKPEKQVAKLEPQKKEAETARAPRLAQWHDLDIERGEKLETGDPYLNELRALIERHRVYPRVMGQFGLPVEGTATYQLVLDRSGRMLLIRLQQSSGAPGIDQAVEGMIRSSAPFPPLPSDYPDQLGIIVAIHLFPPQS